MTGEPTVTRESDYIVALSRLFQRSVESMDGAEIAGYLAANSNLPGPRGNLELAHAFASVAAAHCDKNPRGVWAFCKELVAIQPAEAPTNDPREFLPFCGARAMGVIASDQTKLLPEALSILRGLSRDPRWRTRESVAMALQSLLQGQPARTLKALRTWIVPGDWLAMRAVAAGVAEPAVLRNRSIAEAGLELHKMIFERLLAAKDRGSPEFKVLRQGLEYSLSVVVHALPDEGFEFMRLLTDADHPDVVRILRENLKKARLVKNHAEKVDRIAQLLERKAHIPSAAP